MEGLSNASYKRWTGTEWWTEGYDRLWLDDGDRVSQAELNGADRQEPNDETDKATGSAVSRCQKSEIVYLTADSSEELSELRENETYIIGGICDHNRYKVGSISPS